jgi:pyridoxine 5-phosphate synthase
MKQIKELLLGVNIDHIATVRQARGTRYPEPLQAALVAEHAGADSITLHLREDRRHIQDRDVVMLKDMLQTHMNLEMAATREMLEIATRIQPHDCCLVPEKREELTTEGGLDVKNNLAYLKDYNASLKESGVRVALFIDADLDQIDAAKDSGAPVIEIHTGHYADATTIEQKTQELVKISKAAQHGVEIGLQVNAGHGLDYHNVKAITAIDGIIELNIGHSIISRALFDGLYKAVSDMKSLLIRQTSNHGHN